MWTRTARRVPIVVAVISAAAILVAACSSASGILSTIGSSVDGAAREPALAPALPAANPNPGDQTSLAGQSAGGSSKALYEVNQADLLIIKTGTLDLQVDGLDAALGTAAQKVAAVGGYVSGSQRQGDGSQTTATITYRIPADRWDDALAALRGVATKVLGEQTQTEDVTSQVVDLGARITNLQATEQALQAIMLKATKIADVLAVQQQLTDVRGQIEELTAQKKQLTEQATYSTLTVTYSLREQAVAATTKNFDPNAEVDRASANLVEVFQGLATAGIWFAIVWLPILVGLAIITVVALFILRRVFRSRPGAPVGPSGGAGAGSTAGPEAGSGAEMGPTVAVEA